MTPTNMTPTNAGDAIELSDELLRLVVSRTPDRGVGVAALTMAAAKLLAAALMRDFGLTTANPEHAERITNAVCAYIDAGTEASKLMKRIVDGTATAG